MPPKGRKSKKKVISNPIEEMLAQSMQKNLNLDTGGDGEEFESQETPRMSEASIESARKDEEDMNANQANKTQEEEEK